VPVVRRALLSIAVALAGAAGVTASGWAVQAGALPPPTPATRIAADASVWLHEHPLLVDVFHRDDRRTNGACLRGWFARRHRSKARGSLLVLGSRRTVLFPAQRRVWIAAALRREDRSRILALVGCSGELAQAFATAAQRGGRLTAERSFAANQPAVALELRNGKAERLTLYVSPRSYQPLVAFVDLHGVEATARVFPARRTPAELSRFHLLPEERDRR